MSVPFPDNRTCLICSATAPVSSAFVWDNDRVTSVVCAKHSLRDVILFPGKNGKGRLSVRIELFDEEE